MSQAQDILDHIEFHGSITPKIALEEYGCMRLASRIDDLRNQGYPIKTDMQKAGKKRWASYRMATKEEVEIIYQGAKCLLK